MAGYNRTRYVEQLLEKTESLPPSFTVHLHPEYWVLNNGSKFLYHNQIASLLDDIRAQRIPVDFLELFDAARVPFYDGCMVVELLDYRPQRSREPALKIPEKTRVVLHPNSETLWADICLMNRQNGANWTDKDALEIEAKILLATSQPLCLDPDPHLTRIVNSVLRMSTPTMPPSLKRKAAAMEPEEDGPEKARRSRILSFMAPQNNKSHMPSYRILETLSAVRLKMEENAVRLKMEEAGQGHAPMPGHQYMNGIPRTAPQSHPQPPASTPTPGPVTSQGASPMDLEKKVEASPLVVFNVPLARPNGSNTPLPPQPTHQFVHQHLPVPSGMQPQVYASVQAATEAAKKPVVTPQMQQHYMQQQYQQQQQQQQSHPQNQPRPPSQPQHPQQVPPAQHQQPQQCFTQSPKPPAQPNATPVITQPTPPPFAGAQSPFQPPIPHPHFLQQPPPGVRNGPGPQPTNQQQHQHQQAFFAQQLQHQQLLSQSANILVHQQRMALAANAQRNGPGGGRITPQGVPVQVSSQQLQHPGQSATPSPIKSSPSVTHQQLAAAQAARSSPMPAKAQLQQVQPQQQQHPLSAQQMQMPPHPNRVALAARAASQSQSPHTPQAQVRQQTPQLPNRTPQLQQRTPQQQFQQIQQNQQLSPQVQAQAQAQSQPQSQTQPQTQAQQQQQIPGHPLYTQMYGYPQMNYQMPSGFWPRSMQGIMPTSGATPQQHLMQHQTQQSQQQQSQPQAQQQQASVVGGQPIIVSSQQPQQQSQGPIPITIGTQQTMVAYEQKVKLAQQAAQQQQALNMMAMSKVPVQVGRGKAGQKKTVPKRREVAFD